MTPTQARRVLNAPAEADEETLGRAFRRAVKAAHPDSGGDGERLRQVLEAHKLLKALASGGAAIAPALSARSASRRQPSLEISVAEALFGGEREIVVEGRPVRVKLPCGLRAGEVMKLRNAGSGGADLHVRVSIAEDDALSVRGDDVWVSARAPANFGGRLEISTPRGRRAVWLTRKVGSRRLLRLTGEGLPARDGRSAGDLIVRLEACDAQAESPAREMLRRFAGAWAPV